MRRALPAPSARPAVATLAASLVLLTAATAGAHPAPYRERPDLERPDLERPEPRPCKCRHIEPPLAYAAVTPGAFTTRVADRAHVYDRSVRSCLLRARASSTVLAFSFARGATVPRVTATGPRALAACVAALTWDDFDAPARATTVRFRVSNSPL